MLDPTFPASRDEALLRLAQFVPSAGRCYELSRNTDAGPNQSSAVSRLSPYLRHRLIHEREIISQVLVQHSQSFKRACMIWKEAAKSA